MNDNQAIAAVFIALALCVFGLLGSVAYYDYSIRMAEIECIKERGEICLGNQ